MFVKDLIKVCNEDMLILILDDKNESEIYDGDVYSLEDAIDGIGECEIIKIEVNSAGTTVWTIKEYTIPTHNYTVKIRVTGYAYVDVDCVNNENKIRNLAEYEFDRFDTGDLDDLDYEIIDAVDENDNCIDLEY